MAIELFGFEISRKEENKNIKSPVPTNEKDGAQEVYTSGYAAANYGGYALDLETKATSEADLVTRYKEMAAQPECDQAIDDIVNEMIVHTEDTIVDINLDELEYSTPIKNKIKEEFENVKKLLKFRNEGYNIARDWYIDAHLYYHILIDSKKPREGIQELRKIDPRKIKKVREKKQEIDERTKVKIDKIVNEYYVYAPKGIKASQQSNYQSSGIKFAKDSIVHITSGIMDSHNRMVIGYLHKAIKPLNQLRMLEDATVIYRIARAPERRIFYIDVGNLPKMKAEQYLHDMMTRHKNKLTYDVNTGELRDERKHMTMLEDFWLPRREGGRGTEITTLPGGQNLGEMDDVEYFRRKLYKSLNVPITRMETENAFNLGRSAEITRDEVKFNKFIKRLRAQFNELFDHLLETQLVLKGVMTKKDWKNIREDIQYEYNEDNYYAELKEAEILRERMSLAAEIEQMEGKYFSKEWVRKNVFRMDDSEIDEMKKQIEKEAEEEPDFDMDDEDQAPKPETKTTPKPSITQQPPQPTTPTANSAPRMESFTPPAKISDEEKKLVESMTKFMDSMIEDE